MTVDAYRQSRKEHKRKTCYCDGYHHPHAHGRGDCQGNPNLRLRQALKQDDEAEIAECVNEMIGDLDDDT